MTLDEAFNKYRIVPRAMMAALYVVWIYSAILFAVWFTAHDWTQYENAANAAAVMAYPSAHMGIISTMINSLQKDYNAWKPEG